MDEMSDAKRDLAHGTYRALFHSGAIILIAIFVIGLLGALLLPAIARAMNNAKVTTETRAP